MKGRLIDLTNTIIILKSNIGAQCIPEDVGHETSTEAMSDGKLSQTIKNRLMNEVLVFLSIDE